MMSCAASKFTITQNITVTGHYLSLCLVSLDLAFVLSVGGLFTLLSDVIVLFLQLDSLVPLNS